MAGIYGVSQVNEITPHLYLTSVYGATRDNVVKKGTTLLVNAAQELPKQEISGVESIKLFLDDVPHANAAVYFDRIADKIHEHATRGGRAIVHCALGISRSTALVLAYLVKYKNMSLKHSLDYVSSRRPCVRPNPGFWKQLIDYEKRLNEPNSYSTYSMSAAAAASASDKNSRQPSVADTSIPITIVTSSSSNASGAAQRSLSSIGGSSSSSSSSNHYSNMIPVYHHSYSAVVPPPHRESRPLSASRYTSGSTNYVLGGSSSGSGDLASNQISKSSSNFANIYKTLHNKSRDAYNFNSSDPYGGYGAYASNSSSHPVHGVSSSSSSSYAPFVVRPTSASVSGGKIINSSSDQHRSSLLYNDDDSDANFVPTSYVIKTSPSPPAFATTYRSSYGRY